MRAHERGKKPLIGNWISFRIFKRELFILSYYSRLTKSCQNYFLKHSIFPIIHFNCNWNPMLYHIFIDLAFFGFNAEIQTLAMPQIPNFALCTNCMYLYRMKHKIIFFNTKVNSLALWHSGLQTTLPGFRSLQCRQRLVRLLNIHNQVSQYLMINISLYPSPSLHVYIIHWI